MFVYRQAFISNQYYATHCESSHSCFFYFYYAYCNYFYGIFNGLILLLTFSIEIIWFDGITIVDIYIEVFQDIYKSFVKKYWLTLVIIILNNKFYICHTLLIVWPYDRYSNIFKISLWSSLFTKLNIDTAFGRGK